MSACSSLKEPGASRAYRRENAPCERRIILIKRMNQNISVRPIDYIDPPVGPARSKRRHAHTPIRPHAS
jgi:hypothetical protein